MPGVPSAASRRRIHSAGGAVGRREYSIEQLQLVEAYLAGYDQALADFRAHAGRSSPARRRRSYLGWARAIVRVLVSTTT
jgi:hypothetical protein